MDGKTEKKQLITATLISNEQGGGTFWAMLICTLTIVFYLKGGRAVIEAHVPQLYLNLLLLVFGIVTVFTIGCALHMIFVGDKNSRELRRDLKKQNDEIIKYVLDTQSRISDYEVLTTKNAGTVRPRSHESLGRARRIVSALRVRSEEISALLLSKKSLDLINAYELTSSDLDVIEDCMHSLIGANPVPPIPAGQWFQVVEGLLAEVDADLRRLAA